jgi:hypothetical protein
LAAAAERELESSREAAQSDRAAASQPSPPPVAATRGQSDGEAVTEAAAGGSRASEAAAGAGGEDDFMTELMHSRDAGGTGCRASMDGDSGEVAARRYGRELMELQRQLAYEKKARAEDERALLAAMEESQRLASHAEAAVALRQQVKLLEVRSMPTAASLDTHAPHHRASGCAQTRASSSYDLVAALMRVTGGLLAFSSFSLSSAPALA